MAPRREVLLTGHGQRGDNDVMRHSARILTSIALLLAGAGLCAPAPSRADDDAPQRVILRVNRNLQIRGHLELDEDEVIVVRDLSGDVHSFPRNKILQLVRLVEPGPDQRGMIVLLNGQVQEGVIIEDGFNRVVVEIDGIRTELRRDVVDYVMLEPSFEEQYELFKQQLQPGMFIPHFRLCEWLFQRQRYELAREELDALLAMTRMEEAERLLIIVEAQLRLMRRDGDDGASPAAAGDGGEGLEDEADSGLIDTADLLPQRILTREEVNLIKVMEIDFSAPPKIRVNPETVRRVIESYREDKRVPVSPDGQARLYRTAAEHPLEFLRLLFDLRARELYGEVEVLTEPRALNLFRQRVHNAWLINNCATPRCHGGPNAGRFFLHRKGHKDDRVRYTNLLILDRLELDPQWPLINYETPLDSLVIQHALSRDVARRPHPDVRGWGPVFTAGNRRLLEDTVAWIEAMMHDPRPGYPVDYEPPMINVITGGEEGDPAAPDRVDR